MGGRLLTHEGILLSNRVGVRLAKEQARLENLCRHRPYFFSLDSIPIWENFEGKTS